MPKPLDFAQVEVLRKHLLISVATMAGVMGVSRMTYYKWVTGQAAIRPRKEVLVRAQIIKLLSLITDHEWPTPEVRGLEPSARSTRLLALLSEYQ